MAVQQETVKHLWSPLAPFPRAVNKWLWDVNEEHMFSRLNNLAELDPLQTSKHKTSYPTYLHPTAPLHEQHTQTYKGSAQSALSCLFETWQKQLRLQVLIGHPPGDPAGPAGPLGPLRGSMRARCLSSVFLEEEICSSSLEVLECRYDRSSLICSSVSFCALQRFKRILKNHVHATKKFCKNVYERSDPRLSVRQLWRHAQIPGNLK